MSTNSIQNPSDNHIEKVAEELATLSGTCEEIKEIQLNCATTDDLNNLKGDLETTMTEYTSVMKNTAEQCSFSVTENAEQICDTVNEFKEEFNQKFEDFKANPPVQKVETTHRIAKESWQWYLAMAFTVFSTLLFFAFMFWQEGRIEQCRVSDIKYHYILMNGGVGPEGLDSIESWFNNPKTVRQIESEVRDYENRVQETARTLEQKQRLEEKLNELNSQSSKTSNK